MLLDCSIVLGVGAREKGKEMQKDQLTVCSFRSVRIACTTMALPRKVSKDNVHSATPSGSAIARLSTRKLRVPSWLVSVLLVWLWWSIWNWRMLGTTAPGNTPILVDKVVVLVVVIVVDVLTSCSNVRPCYSNIRAPQNNSKGNGNKKYFLK